MTGGTAKDLEAFAQFDMSNIHKGRLSAASSVDRNTVELTARVSS